MKKGFFQSVIKRNKIYHPVMFKVCEGGHLALDSVFSTNKYEYSAMVSSNTAELYFLRIKNVHRLNLDYPMFKEVLRQISSKLKANRTLKAFKLNNTLESQKLE